MFCIFESVEDKHEVSIAIVAIELSIEIECEILQRNTASP